MEQPLRRARLPLLALLMLIWGLVDSDPAAAWRETGHFAVCEIAYRSLTPAARQEVDALLEGRDFAAGCTWPDIVRNDSAWGFTYPWHFINLDDGEEYMVAGNVSPKGDVFQALLLMEAKLLDPETSAAERLVALRFLSHFAGDSHQPLHVGRKTDLGGNTIQVTWFGDETFKSVAIELAPEPREPCGENGSHVHSATGECVVREVTQPKVNLHKIWDLLMIQRFLEKARLPVEEGDSEFQHKAFATAATNAASEMKSETKSETTSERARRVAEGETFWDWVSESMALREQAYDVGRGRLRWRFYRRNVKTVQERIAVAGFRLASTLNRIFDRAGRTASDGAVEAKHRELRKRMASLAGATSPLRTRIEPGTLIPSAPGNESLAAFLDHEICRE